MGVCVCVYLLVYMPMCVDAEARERCQVSLSTPFGLLLNSSSLFMFMSRDLLSLSSNAGVTGRHAQPCFLHGCWRFELSSSRLHSKLSYSLSHLHSPIDSNMYPLGEHICWVSCYLPSRILWWPKCGLHALGNQDGWDSPVPLVY